MAKRDMSADTAHHGHDALCPHVSTVYDRHFQLLRKNCELLRSAAKKGGCLCQIVLRRVCPCDTQHEHESWFGLPGRSPGSDISKGPALELPRPDELALRSCASLLYTVMPRGGASPAPVCIM